MKKRVSKSAVIRTLANIQSAERAFNKPNYQCNGHRNNVITCRLFYTTSSAPSLSVNTSLYRRRNDISNYAPHENENRVANTVSNAVCTDSVTVYNRSVHNHTRNQLKLCHLHTHTDHRPPVLLLTTIGCCF